MEPIRKTRLSDKAIEAIDGMILQNGFRAGDRFYSEHELARELQISRSSIREAIRILEVRGRVTVRQGKGIYVAGPGEEKSDLFSGWLKDNKTPIIDHFEVRLIIEPKAACRAAEEADEESLRAMEDAHEKFLRAAERGDTASLVSSDGDFHRLIAKSTKNRTLYYLMKTMTRSLSEGWITSLHVPGRVEKTVREHGDILAAIRAGDPEAAEKTMIRHLTNALADIRASMEE